MKIISLQAENIKRLVAVEIRPDGNLVEITGKNGQGKTSVLDSIWWALDGKEAIQSRPIRNGFHEASIIVVLGEDKPQLIVTRTFKIKPDGETTTSLVVESPEGAKFGSPQKMLDAFLGALTFDPLAFARMKPCEQYDELKRFVPGVDFDGIANLNRGDRDRRADLNRAAKQERAAAAVIIVPEETSVDLVDVKALVDELSEAGEFNSSIEARKIRRQQVAENAKAARNRAAQILEGGIEGAARLSARFKHDAADLAKRISALEDELVALRGRLAANGESEQRELEEYAAQVNNNAKQFMTEADGLQKQLDEAEELPAPVDTEVLRKRIDAAGVANALSEKLRQRTVHEMNAGRLESQAEALTTAIADREAAKNAAIAAAQMPVAGITFGEDEVLLNGVPFNQGSDAEQLAASVDIAMAMNPKLRVIRIRDGSLLDPDSMKLLEEKADKQKMQVWCERVDATGKVGFVIEDGHVRKAGAAAAAEEAVA